MCIRDRIKAITRAPWGEREQTAATWYEPLRDQGAIDLVTPVSYTHLRAHETVLDLVCRLLLEKKKKHNP